MLLLCVDIQYAEEPVSAAPHLCEVDCFRLNPASPELSNPCSAKLRSLDSTLVSATLFPADPPILRTLTLLRIPRGLTSSEPSTSSKSSALRAA